jgi:hypothetical protein
MAQKVQGLESNDVANKQKVTVSASKIRALDLLLKQDETKALELA